MAVLSAKRFMENNKYFFAEASGGEIKTLVDNSAKRNTQKNPQHIQERSTCVRLEKLFGNYSKLHSCLRGFASWPCSFFGQSFSLGQYPPIYQPPKGVYLLSILMSCHVSLCIAKYYHLVYTTQVNSAFGAR